MENLCKFLASVFGKEELEPLEAQAKEEASCQCYVDYIFKKMRQTTQPDDIDEISLAAIKALNNFAGNLRSACSETNRNVIRKHVDLPYEGGVIGGHEFTEFFVDTCRAMVEFIPGVKDYVRENILQKALNGVVSEDKQSVISSKFCELEQGHPKEDKAELFIPRDLYTQFVQNAAQRFGDSLLVPACEEIDQAIAAENVAAAEEQEEEGGSDKSAEEN